MFRLRLGDVSTNTQLLGVCTMQDPATDPFSAGISGGGSFSIETASLRVDELPDRGLWTLKISFLGLSPDTEYSYTVAQGEETITGSFRTLPASPLADFAFIVQSCDANTFRHPVYPYTVMRNVVLHNDPPVIFAAHVDDVAYVDRLDVSDSETGFFSTGNPQDTRNPRDYALGWAATYGMFRTSPKHQMADRQWVYRNLPTIYSPGDHGFGGNHCRGEVHDPGYIGCDRGPGSREEAALGEWNAFYNHINPPALRSDKLHWGKDAGIVRLALWDSQLYCQPYDAENPDPDLECYGPEQIADLMAWLDVDNVPFKIGLKERSVVRGNQPWLSWHPNEAEAWLADMQQRPNLNGTLGAYAWMTGDNHSTHAINHDDFWTFCAGVLNGSQVSGQGLEGADGFGWGGSTRFVRGSFENIDDSIACGFILVEVFGSRSPARLQVSLINAGTGERWYQCHLDAGSVANQFVETFSAGPQDFGAVEPE